MGIYVYWCLNSHLFPVAGDDFPQPNSRGLHSHCKNSLLGLRWPSPPNRELMDLDTSLGKCQYIFVQIASGALTAGWEFPEIQGGLVREVSPKDARKDFFKRNYRKICQHIESTSEGINTESTFMFRGTRKLDSFYIARMGFRDDCFFKVWVFLLPPKHPENRLDRSLFLAGNG